MSHLSGLGAPHHHVHTQPRRQVEPPVVTIMGVSRDYPSIPPGCWGRYDFTQGLPNLPGRKKVSLPPGGRKAPMQHHWAELCYDWDPRTAQHVPHAARAFGPGAANPRATTDSGQHFFRAGRRCHSLRVGRRRLCNTSRDRVATPSETRGQCCHCTLARAAVVCMECLSFGVNTSAGHADLTPPPHIPPRSSSLTGLSFLCPRSAPSPSCSSPFGAGPHSSVYPSLALLLLLALGAGQSGDPLQEGLPRKLTCNAVKASLGVTSTPSSRPEEETPPPRLGGVPPC